MTLFKISYEINDIPEDNFKSSYRNLVKEWFWIILLRVTLTNSSCRDGNSSYTASKLYNEVRWDETVDTTKKKTYSIVQKYR